ncbi:MAG TPA: transposase [Nocardioidaceae bacterium]|nr:transposase [Nocardioidaceae bacterium]
MAEWLPADHLVWFVLDVVEQLDTSVFHRRHPRSGPGRAAYDPDMLLALLLYAYAVGERSSRRIEALCRDHVAFRVLCAQDAPDHTTIARFRAVHEGAFADLFSQVLVLCAQAGMGKIGMVSIDGTKIAANASMNANRGEESLRKLAASIIAEAAEVDAAEDAEHGDARGDELPSQWADRSGRKDRIKQALEEIRKQQQDAEQADQADRTKAEEYLRRVEAGESVRGVPPNGLDPVRLNRARVARALAQADAAAPETEARREAHRRARRFQRQLEQAEQAVAAGAVDLDGAAAKFRRRRGNTNPIANTTDPDSRKMMSRHGFVQGFNAQIAVSDDHLILATSISQDSNDNSSFEPMMNAAVAAAAAITDNAEIGIVLADAGYFSQHNLTIAGPDRLIAFGKNREVKHEANQHPADGPPPTDASVKEQMRHRLRTEQGQQAYRRRSATVETMIAHLKDQVGLRRFSRRGLTAAASELDLAAAVINLRRLHSKTGLATA